MYKEPFIVLKEKIPFIEFFIRILSFIKSPHIDKKLLYDSFSECHLKYALYDIISALSAVYIICLFFSCLFFHINFDKLLSIIENPVLIYIDILIKSYCSLIIFFSIVLVLLILFRKKNIIKSTFLVSLQYAEWYSIFILIVLTIFYIVYITSITYLKSPKEIIQNHPFLSRTILVLFIWITFRCCILPIARFLELCKKSWISVVLILLIFFIATSINFTSRMLPSLRINRKMLYQIIIEKHYLTPKQKEMLKKFLKSRT